MEGANAIVDNHTPRAASDRQRIDARESRGREASARGREVPAQRATRRPHLPARSRLFLIRPVLDVALEHFVFETLLFVHGFGHVMK